MKTPLITDKLKQSSLIIFDIILATITGVSFAIKFCKNLYNNHNINNIKKEERQETLDPTTTTKIDNSGNFINDLSSSTQTGLDDNLLTVSKYTLEQALNVRSTGEQLLLSGNFKQAKSSLKQVLDLPVIDIDFYVTSCSSAFYDYCVTVSKSIKINSLFNFKKSNNAQPSVEDLHTYLTDHANFKHDFLFLLKDLKFLPNHDELYILVKQNIPIIDRWVDKVMFLPHHILADSFKSAFMVKNGEILTTFQSQLLNLSTKELSILFNYFYSLEVEPLFYNFKTNCLVSKIVTEPFENLLEIYKLKSEPTFDQTLNLLMNFSNSLSEMSFLPEFLTPYLLFTIILMILKNIYEKIKIKYDNCN